MGRPATDPTDRRTGVVLLVAAMLLTGGNLAHPVDAAPSATSRLDLATGAGWLAVHLVVAAGFVALAVGFVLLASRSRGTVAGAVTVVAAIVGGGTLALVFAGLDGYGFLALAGAADDPATMTAAVALNAVDTGLAGVGTILLMGVAMLALAQVLRTTPSPAARWVVPAGVLVGLLGSTAGVALLWAGATPATINGLLRPTAMAMTLVVIALGLSFVRGRRPRRHTVETPTGRATPSTPG